MRPMEAMHCIALHYAAGESAIFLGDPGEGKTHVPHHVAKCHKIGYHSQRVPHLDVVDLRGLADLNCTTTLWKAPADLPTLEAVTSGRCPERGITVYDEVTAGLPAIMATLYEVFETRPDGSRWLAGHRLAPGWVPFGSGNKLTSRSVAHRIPAALISRVGLYEFANTIEDFTNWACGGESPPIPSYRTPPDPHLIEPEIIAFTRKRPELLNNFDKVKANDNEPYACPRSWAGLSRLLKTCKANNIGHKPPKGKGDQYQPYLSLEMVTGRVGKQAAAEFLPTLDTFDLPSWEEILLDPTQAPVPEEPSMRYAVAAMAGRMVDKLTFEQGIGYLSRMPKSFEVLAIQTAMRCNRDSDGKVKDSKKDITACKAFQLWASKNQSVLQYA